MDWGMVDHPNYERTNIATNQIATDREARAFRCQSQATIWKSAIGRKHIAWHIKMFVERNWGERIQCEWGDLDSDFKAELAHIIDGDAEDENELNQEIVAAMGRCARGIVNTLDSEAHFRKVTNREFRIGLPDLPEADYMKSRGHATMPGSMRDDSRRTTTSNTAVNAMFDVARGSA